MNEGKLPGPPRLLSLESRKSGFKKKACTESRLDSDIYNLPDHPGENFPTTPPRPAFLWNQWGRKLIIIGAILVALAILAMILL